MPILFILSKTLSLSILIILSKRQNALARFRDLAKMAHL